MQRTTEGFSEAERLGSKEIEQIFASGAAGKSHLFVARCLPNGLPHSRIAPIVGKKSGKAVRRNRIKRLIRQSYRTHKAEFRSGFDFAFIARAGVDTATAADLLESLVKAAARACAEADRARPAQAPATGKKPAAGAAAVACMASAEAATGAEHAERGR